MTDLLLQLLDFAAAHPSLVGLIVLLAAAAEAIIVVGAIIPGTAIVVALAGVAGALHADVWLLVLWATLGAVLGDGVSYWIGRRYGGQLQRSWLFRRQTGLLNRGTAFFGRHGGKGVFFARFVPGVRAVVPVAAGMLGMTAPRFYSANITSAALWSASHVLPAAGLGVAIATVGNMSGRLVLWAGLALIAILIMFWVARLTVVRLAPLVASAYDGAIAHLAERQHPLARRVARILDPTHPRLGAIALWSAVLVLASMGFLGVLESLVAGDPLVRADTAINHLVQSLRTPLGDSLSVFVTAFGDTIIVGAITAFVIAWLALRRAFVTAGAVALTMGISVGFMFAMKAVLHKPRPIGIFAGLDSFSFPSGHTVSATVLLGVIAVLVTKAMPRTVQIGVFTAAAVAAAAIGLSRIYLSAHWPSDVLGGFCFGVGMTAIFGLVFEHLPAERIGRAGLAVAVTTVFAGLGTWHAMDSREENLARYAVRPVETVLTRDDWLGGAWRRLPAYRSDVAGGLEEPLILQWGGAADRLAAIAAGAGWTATQPWSALDALQFLNPTAALADLVPLPLLHDGKLPVLTMIQPLPADDQHRLVLRLWSSHTFVVEPAGRAPALVGSITSEAITHPFGLITTLRDSAPPAAARPALAAALRAADTVTAIVPPGGDRPIVPTLALPAGAPPDAVSAARPADPGAAGPPPESARRIR